MTILIISNKWDVSVDYVIKNLRERNLDYRRLNTEDLIEKKSVFKIPHFSYKIIDEKEIDITNISSILLRRPGKSFEFMSNTEKPSEPIVNFIVDQWNSFLYGLQSFPKIFWINHPQKNIIAESKINQLIIANKIGLQIPKTCITSSKNEIIDLWKECNGKIITKALYSPLIKNNKDEYFIFSNRVKNLQEIKTDELSLAPCIFQEEINNKTDYRVTIIGNESFCVKIKIKNSSTLDWRTEKNGIEYERIELPNNIINKCKKLTRELGLVFGAIDLVEVNNEFYFLEINPSGEWGWLQKNVNLPIAETIVDYLSGEKSID